MASQPSEALAEPIEQTGAAEETVQDNLYPSDTPPANDAGDQLEGEQGEQIEGEETPALVEPPKSWKAEEQEVFKTLPPEAQAVIQRREAERDKYVFTKGNEAAQQVRNTESQAREAILKVQQAHMAQVSSLLGEPPQQPDHRLLQTGQEEHRALFYQQEAEIRAWSAQQQQLQQHLAGVQSQAAQLEQLHLNAQREQDEAVLAEKLGDSWTDPSLRQKLFTDLEPIGGELGYSKELMAQANATDILALKRAHEWKSKAAKWDDLQKRKMTPVRAAKQPPQVTQPGVSGGGNVQSNAPVQNILYPNDVRR